MPPNSQAIDFLIFEKIALNQKELHFLGGDVLI